jgi:hypothetical protein
MASMDTRAIEGEIDRIRSLGLEELRCEWRRLNHGEPPRISRDLLVLVFCPGNSLTKSRELLEDGVSGSGPHEGV